MVLPRPSRTRPTNLPASSTIWSKHGSRLTTPSLRSLKFVITSVASENSNLRQSKWVTRSCRLMPKTQFLEREKEISMTLDDIIRSYDPSTPLAEASTIPASWYLDPRVADLERQTVFSQSWQVVGRMEQFENPGQYVTCTVAGEPLVFVCGNDRTLRGFFNV